MSEVRPFLDRRFSFSGVDADGDQSVSCGRALRADEHCNDQNCTRVDRSVEAKHFSAETDAHQGISQPRTQHRPGNMWIIFYRRIIRSESKRILDTDLVI